MYHTVATNALDRHTLRFLWSKMETTRVAYTEVLIGFEYVGFHALKGQRSKHLAPVVQKMDNAIHRINHYPVDSVVCFVSTYPLDSDLFDG